MFEIQLAGVDVARLTLQMVPFLLFTGELLCDVLQPFFPSSGFSLSDSLEGCAASVYVFIKQTCILFIPDVSKYPFYISALLSLTFSV